VRCIERLIGISLAILLATACRPVEDGSAVGHAVSSPLVLSSPDASLPATSVVTPSSIPSVESKPLTPSPAVQATRAPQPTTPQPTRAPVPTAVSSTAPPGATPTLPSIYGFPTVPPGSTGCIPTWVDHTTECKASGLPPGATATVTANGAPVTIPAGYTTVLADGTYQLYWAQREVGTVTFVVTAGGISRTFQLVVRPCCG